MKRVLIVDDDADIRALLELIVEEEGYPTQVANDGLEAMEQVRHSDPPSMILLDLKMPRLDGESVLRAIRADPELKKIPVVVLSGDLVTEDRLRRLGADDLLVKPVDLDQVLEVLHRYAPST